MWRGALKISQIIDRLKLDEHFQQVDVEHLL